MLNEPGGVGQQAICANAQHIHTAASIVGNQHIFAAMVHHQMAGAAAAGGLLIQEFERAALRVERKRADSPGFPALKISDLADAVEKPA